LPLTLQRKSVPSWHNYKKSNGWHTNRDYCDGSLWLWCVVFIWITLLFSFSSLSLLLKSCVAGKTSVGETLKRLLNAEGDPASFFDADGFHPISNVEKMRAGIPLTDEDRKPWLLTLHQLLDAESKLRKFTILGCSALKRRYRHILLHGEELKESNDPFAPPFRLLFVHLAGDFQVIFSRLQQRKNHYMPASLLQSQFDALEEITPTEEQEGYQLLKLDINKDNTNILASKLFQHLKTNF
jgi:gluconokinase